MPQIPETVIAMLACARIGAVHSVVFGGFAPPQLAQRIAHAKPKVTFLPLLLCLSISLVHNFSIWINRTRQTDLIQTIAR